VYFFTLTKRDSKKCKKLSDYKLIPTMDLYVNLRRMKRKVSKGIHFLYTLFKGVIRLYTEKLWTYLKELENKEEATKMKQYMKGHFEFFGIRAPVMNKSLKQFLNENKLPEHSELFSFLKEVWAKPEREMQTAGIAVADRLKEKMAKKDIEWIEYIIVTKSWWDTVDHIAKHIAGFYFQKYPETRKSVLDRWIASENIWLMRSAILYQLGYKEKTDKERLGQIIKATKYETDFFTLLRNYKFATDWFATK
jgi:3-methyladenine DNA glycosylase AlkD